MILIVSAADDDHVAAVEPELRRRGASVLRRGDPLPPLPPIFRSPFVAKI